MFAFFAEIQDGCQKWRANKFCGKLPVDAGHTLLVKNFIEIALSRTIIEINAFLHFTQKVKNFAKIALSYTIIEINTFLSFLKNLKKIRPVVAKLYTIKNEGAGGPTLSPLFPKYKQALRDA